MTIYPKNFRSIGQILIELLKIYSFIKKHWNSFVTHCKSNGRSSAASSSSGLEVSSAISGKGLVWQAFMLASSFFRFRLSVLTSSLQPMQQRGRQRIILTFLVLQSISGLCSLSQVIPRIRFCLLRLVTVNSARSECFS